MLESLTIGDTEYKLPTDYTISEWIELHKIGWHNPVPFMAKAFNIPEDQMELLNREQLEMGGSFVYLMVYPEKHKKALKPINFPDLTLGQFIDLEMCIDEGKDAMVKMCNLIFDKEIKPETSITKVYDGYSKYIKYRNMLYFNYKGLFNIDDDNQAVGDIPQDKPSNNAHVWMDMVMILADNDFLKMSVVTERPVIEAFNYLAYTKDKKLKEIQEAKRQQQIKKLQRA